MENKCSREILHPLWEVYFFKSAAFVKTLKIRIQAHFIWNGLWWIACNLNFRRTSLIYNNTYSNLLYMIRGEYFVISLLSFLHKYFRHIILTSNTWVSSSFLWFKSYKIVGFLIYFLLKVTILTSIKIFLQSEERFHLFTPDHVWNVR